jgi:hypothetical protein
MTALAIGSDSKIVQQAAITAINQLKPGFASGIIYSSRLPKEVGKFRLSWPLTMPHAARLAWIVPQKRLNESEILNAVRWLTLQRLRSGFVAEILVPRITKETQELCRGLGCLCSELKLCLLLSLAKDTQQNSLIDVENQRLYFASLAYLIHGFQDLLRNRANLYHPYLKPLLDRLNHDFDQLECTKYATWARNVNRSVGDGKPMSESDSQSWQELKGECDQAASEVLRLVRSFPAQS